MSWGRSVRLPLAPPTSPNSPARTFVRWLLSQKEELRNMNALPISHFSPRAVLEKDQLPGFADEEAGSGKRVPCPKSWVLHSGRWWEPRFSSCCTTHTIHNKSLLIAEPTQRAPPPGGLLGGPHDLLQCFPLTISWGPLPCWPETSPIHL